jgi:hypothetical protein
MTDKATGRPLPAGTKLFVIPDNNGGGGNFQFALTQSDADKGIAIDVEIDMENCDEGTDDEGKPKTSVGDFTTPTDVVTELEDDEDDPSDGSEPPTKPFTLQVTVKRAVTGEDGVIVSRPPLKVDAKAEDAVVRPSDYELTVKKPKHKLRTGDVVLYEEPLVGKVAIIGPGGKKLKTGMRMNVIRKDADTFALAGSEEDLAAGVTVKAMVTHPDGNIPKGSGAGTFTKDDVGSKVEVGYNKNNEFYVDIGGGEVIKPIIDGAAYEGDTDNW